MLEESRICTTLRINSLLAQTLEEEWETDGKLSELAEDINVEAGEVAARKRQRQESYDDCSP